MFFNVIKNKIYTHTDQWNLNGKLITFLNPFSYLKLRESKIDLDSVDIIMIDGILLVYFLNLIGIRCKRRSFDMTSMAPLLFEKCHEENKKIFLLGSTSEEIELAVENIICEFPKLRIYDYHNGFVSEDEITHIVSKLVEDKVDYLVIGMGTPLQEITAIKIRNLGYDGTIFTCGGFFHQTAKNTIYYPDWVNRLHLRWMYRIYDEPKLFKRYLIYYPKFVLVFTLDVINSLLRK